MDYQIVEDVGLSRSRSWEVALIIFDCFMRCGYLRDSTYISCKEGEFINTLFKIWCQISYWTDFLFRRIIIVGFEGKVNTNIVVECFKRIKFWALHRKDKWDSVFVLSVSQNVQPRQKWSIQEFQQTLGVRKNTKMFFL